MSLLSLVLFVHILGALGVFGAIALEAVSLAALRRATDSTQVASAAASLHSLHRLAGPSFGLAILTGLYLTAVVWGWRTAWIDISIVALIVSGALGGAVSGRRMARLEHSTRTESSSQPNGTALATARDPILWLSFTVRTGMLIGVVFLMTVKPGLYASLAAIVIAAALGALFALRR